MSHAGGLGEKSAFGACRSDVRDIFGRRVFFGGGMVDTDFGTREPVFHYYVLLLAGSADYCLITH